VAAAWNGVWEAAGERRTGHCVPEAMKNHKGHTTDTTEAKKKLCEIARQKGCLPLCAQRLPFALQTSSNRRLLQVQTSKSKQAHACAGGMASLLRAVLWSRMVCGTGTGLRD
jgi:hypothetical protein